MPDMLARLKKLFRLRFAIFYPLGAYLVFFTAPDDMSLRFGIAFMLAGLAMRLWSNGYAIKMDKLTTSGPYAFVRNPLYVGTWLIMLGVAVMLKILLAGIIFFTVLLVVYRRTILSEEQMLTKKFGQDFLDYKARVPAVWPTFFPYASGEKWPFNWKRLWESREHKVALWVAIVVIGFHIKEELMVEADPVDAKIIALLIAACLLGILDLIGEYVRARQKDAATRILSWGLVFAFGAGMMIAAGDIHAAEKTFLIDAVNDDLQDGLGLTQEQKEKVSAIREAFKARQQQIRREINMKNEALRQGLDADDPVRARVDAVAAEIKLLQGQLMDNRIDVVFKLREVYSPQQIKMIKARLEKRRKDVPPRKVQKKGKKLEKKKTAAKDAAANER